MAISFNFQDGEMVSSPTVIVLGQTSKTATGVVLFTNNENRVFPPQHFEVNNGHFKAILHVSEGTNSFSVEIAANGVVSPLGFAEFRGQPQIADLGKLLLHFNSLPQNKPLHLCLMVAKDSPGSFDMPHYRLQRGEQATLDAAIRKIKVAGRLMQAYTQDEFRAIGLSNRTFQVVEETVHQQGLFGYSVDLPTPHTEIKVHVLRSPKTVAELRDPNLAQQNPHGSDTGGLFSHALDVIKTTPEIFDKKRQLGSAVQCAVIYLDATYDTKNDMILTHAALGGGDADVKLAIFGSHGLHSWPTNFAQVVPSFLDATQLSKREVANDAGECGTSWECMNITMGAFMHEIGHLFGSPHQVDGVMLRDYVWWNRSFMTREFQSLRTGSRGETIRTDGSWPRVCHWNRLDLYRYLYHDSFGLPIDSGDKTFGKVYSTMTKMPQGTKEASLYHTPNGTLIKSDSGVFLIEFITDDLARHHRVFFPRAYGGQGCQKEVSLDYQTCYQEFKKSTGDSKDTFDIRVLSLDGDIFINDFKSHASSKDKQLKSDLGLNRGTITAYRSDRLGKVNGNEQVIGFDLKTVYKVRVYHGGALDGMRFYFTLGQSGPPPVPSRNYLGKMMQKMSVKEQSAPGGQREVTIGNKKDGYTDFQVPQGEYITKFHFRNGAWIDAVQFETNSGTKSPMYGNANGGHLLTLEAPGRDYEVVGMYGFTGSWMDGVGVVYTGK